jgi:hypothetical protein
VFGLVPDERCADGVVRVEGVGLIQGCDPKAAAGVTRPESGAMRPVSMPSRLDFPSPLRPTIPMRAPSLTPTVTESKTT